MTSLPYDSGGELSEPSKSIRGPNDSSFDRIEDTFYSMMSIEIPHPIGSMSISPANRDVALGARKGLFIVDLQNPYDPPRFLPHYAGYREVADVQWNPFPSRSEWVVSTSNQKAVVYNLSLSPSLTNSPIEHTLHAHTRAVTDINWSPNSSEVLATCALDGWVWSWDLRKGGRKPVWGVCSWGSGATQVKWNRREEHVIASAHDNRVLIWDDRMGAVPVTTINGHSAKIYGIDWSRRDPKMLITCSLDKSFKSWHTSNPLTPDLTVNTSTPVWRARYLPFGRGALTLPQRGDHALSIWGRQGIEKTKDGEGVIPVARFEGAREGVKEFVWRTRGGDDMENDDREFQLVTWSKDRRLRLWPISDEIMKEVGQIKGSKIQVQMTRRKCPNISYRTFGDHVSQPFTLSSPPFASLLARNPQEKLNQPSNLSQVIQASPLRSTAGAGPSLLTSSLLAGGISTNGNNTQLPPNATALANGVVNRGSATMTTTSANHHSRLQNAHDRLVWMEGVKVHKPLAISNLLSPTGSLYPSDIDPNSNEDQDEEGGDEGKGTTVVAGELTTVTTTTSRPSRGRPTTTLIDPDTTSRGIETRSSSLQRGTDGGITLKEGGDTERAESLLMSGSRTTAHPTGSGSGTGRDLVHANLGEEVTSVVRRFPRVNFEKVHVAGRTCTVSLYSPIFLRATFTFPKSYPHSSPPTIELERNADITLKSRAFLLQSLRKLMASRAQLGLPSLEFALRFLLGDRNDLDQGGKKGSGGTGIVVDDDDDDEGDETLRGLSLAGSQTLGRNINVPPPRRGGAIFGPHGQLIVFFPTNVFVSPLNEKEDQPESTPFKTKFPLRVSEAFGNIAGERDSPTTEDAYQETDEALQLSTGISFRLSGHTHPRRSLNSTSSSLPPSSFSTTVHVKDVSHLTLLQPERIVNFLDRPPLEVAHAALDAALENRDALLVQLWSTMSAFLEHSHDSAFGLSRKFETVLAGRVLPELLNYLGQLRDIQTLGVVACLLEVYRRALLGAANPSTALPPSPADDYFSPRKIDSAIPLPFDSADYDPTTPHASDRPLPLLSPSDSSPRASWTNLGALFNNSVLSLRGGTPPTPGTLDRMYQSGTARPAYSGGLSSPRISKISPRMIRTDSNSPVEGRRSGSSGGRLERDKKPSLERQQSRVRVIKEIPVVTFGNTSTIGGKGKGGEAVGTGGVGKTKKRVVVRYKDPCTVNAPVHWWLTERAQTELELLRLAYAELLYRWGLDNDRVEVLKLCRSSSLQGVGKNYGATLLRAGNGFDKDYGVDLTRSCAKCKAALQAPYISCSACHTRQKKVLCIVCHLPVLKLSQNCTTCCHVGHVDCLQRWYSGDAECPSGCGCSCVASGGLEGVFVAELPEPSKPKISLSTSSFRPKLSSFRNSLPYFAA